MNKLIELCNEDEIECNNHLLYYVSIIKRLNRVLKSK